jgi:hypothetical protein
VRDRESVTRRKRLRTTFATPVIIKRGWRKEWSLARAAIEKASIRDAGHIAKSN